MKRGVTWWFGVMIAAVCSLQAQQAVPTPQEQKTAAANPTPAAEQTARGNAAATPKVDEATAAAREKQVVEENLVAKENQVIEQTVASSPPPGPAVSGTSGATPAAGTGTGAVAAETVPIPEQIASDQAVVSPSTVPPAVAEPLPQPGLATDVGGELFRGTDNKEYAAANPAEINHMQWDFQLTIEAAYDDNVYIASDDKEDDFYVAIAPAVSLTLGDYLYKKENYLVLAYEPAYIIYFDNSDLNSWEHHALFDAQYRIAKLTLGAEFRFESLSGADTDVGGRADRNLYFARLRAEYLLTGKISVETWLEWSFWDYDSRLDSNELAAYLFLNYQVTGKLKIGPGFGIGWLDVEESSDQQFEQLLVKAEYQSSEKLAFTARAGVEFREVEDGDATNPVFAIGAIWKPYVNTTVTLDAYKRIRSSPTERGQNFDATGIAAQVRQKIMQRFEASFLLGYENSEYDVVDDDDWNDDDDFDDDDDWRGDREDNYFYARAGLAYHFREWLTAELFYRFRRNDSNFDDRSFTQNIVGMQVVLRY